MKEEINIRVVVAGVEYPLKVQKGEEVSVLEAVQIVEKQIAEYKKEFWAADKSYLLPIVALQIAMDLVKLRSDNDLLQSQALEHIDFLSKMTRMQIELANAA